MDGRVHRQWVDGAYGQPMTLRHSIDQSLCRGIGLDLGLGGSAYADGARVGGNGEVRENVAGVDPLIEGDKDDRLQTDRPPIGMTLDYRRRRRAEAPAKGLGQLGSRGRLDAGPKLGPIGGGHGEPLVDLEHEGSGTDPAPSAFRTRAQPDRHFAGA